jgi:hypothetical protein
MSVEGYFRRGPMIRISLPYIFNLNNQMEGITTLPDSDALYKEVWIKMYIAEAAVEALTTNSLYAPYLRTSFAAAEVFLATVKEHTSKPYDDDRIITQYEFYAVKQAYGNYKIALLAELGALGCFFVSQKGGFDTVSLLSFGENLFPSELIKKVPEASFDAKEAGKCLAYEVPTSCGFHVFRVTESVLRRYYAHVTGGAAAPKVRTLGVYVHALRTAKKGDEKILAALKQMTDLHRNPLIHPEAVLTIDEAIAILGIARSVITAMVNVLPVVPPTTGTATPASPSPAAL